MNPFDPVGVLTHEDDQSLIPEEPARLASVTVVDEATEAGHPVVIFKMVAPHPEGAAQDIEVDTLMSMKQFLITVKLVMDAYPDYVREAFSL